MLLCYQTSIHSYFGFFYIGAGNRSRIHSWETSPTRMSDVSGNGSGLRVFLSYGI
jgi:hypothetical protein